MRNKVVVAASIGVIALLSFNRYINKEQVHHVGSSRYSFIGRSNRDVTKRRYCAITKGTCHSSGDTRTAYHGDICVERIVSRNGIYSLDSCLSTNQHGMDMSISLLSNKTDMGEVHTFSNQRINLNQKNQCKEGSCECTATTPCICEAHKVDASNEIISGRDEIFLCDDPSQTLAEYFDRDTSIHHERSKNFNDISISRQAQDVIYKVVWDIDLGGKESILESPYLKASFEQSIKDYINNKGDCTDGIYLNNAANEVQFYDLEIPYPFETGRKLGVSGSGRCRGSSNACRREVKETQSDAGRAARNYREVNNITSTYSNSVQHRDDDFCAAFSNTTIFDALKDRIAQASSYSYDIDVNVGTEFLTGDSIITTQVRFVPISKDGLNSINDIGMTPDDPFASGPNCNVPQCLFQRQVVKELFFYFDLPFIEGKHECAFQGINCNNDELITYMFLDNKNLAGRTIPDNFGRLTSLKGLFLGRNQLVGTIPPALGGITSLEMLWLDNNNLVGEIPVNLTELENLVQLNLFNNNFNGSLPPELFLMKKLEMLELGNNSISGIVEFFPPEVEPPPCPRFPRIPILQWLYDLYLSIRDFIIAILTFEGTEKDDIPQAPSLKILSLDNNLLNGTIPSFLSILENLEELVLSNNKLTGLIPTQLGSLGNLVVADLRDNELYGSIPSELGNLNKLEILNLYNNKLEKSLPTEIGNIASVKELILDNNILTGAIPSEYGKLVNTVSFTFTNNEMGGTLPPEIGNLVEMKFFDFRNYAVSYENTTRRELQGSNSNSPCIPETYGELRSVENFLTSDDNGLTGPLPNSIGGMTNLTVIWLDDQQITGEFPEEFFELKNVVVLTIDNNEIEGAPFEGLSQMTSLRVLSVQNNNINDTITDSIGNLTQLQVFDFADNENLDGEFTEELLEELPLIVINAAGTAISGDVAEILTVVTLEVVILADTDVSGNLTGVDEIGLLVQLTTLDIGDTEVTGEISANITSTQLVILDIGNTDIDALPEAMDNMETFDVLVIDGTNITAVFWMCKLSSLTFEQFEEAECDNYCGQNLQQCADDADAAEVANCEKTQCTGGGTPGCTSTCKIDYTKCEPNAEELDVRLEFIFDNKARETDWEVRNTNLDEVAKEKDQNYTNYRSYTEYFCLDRSFCYDFTIFDSGNDGLCQSESNERCTADFELFIEDEEQQSNPYFNTGAYTLAADIGSCTDSPTLSPIEGITTAPVPSPPTIFLSPTLFPTLKPSITPSLQPSSSPIYADYLVVVTIDFDFHVEEISWSIVNDEDETVVEYEYNPAETLPYGTETESLTLTGGICYVFTIFDSAGDGLANGERNYDYEITVNGVSVPDTDPDFGSEASHNLGDYCVD